jgi:hypothetical protein
MIGALVQATKQALHHPRRRDALRGVHDRESGGHSRETGLQEAEESEGRCLCGAIAGLCREIGCQGESAAEVSNGDIPELDRPQPDQSLNPVGVAGREGGDQSLIRLVRLERVVAQSRERRQAKRGGPIRGVAR